MTAHKELRNITGGIAMIGGMFETIGKTLGVGKEKYFLELDDAAEASVKSLKTTAPKAAKVAVETVKEASTEAVDKLPASAQSSDQSSEDKVSEGKATQEKAPEAKVAPVKAAKETTAKKAVAKTKASAPATTPAVPAEPSAKDLIVAAIAATSSGKPIDTKDNTVEDSATFSTDYLMTPSRSSRRRPGPSLAAFKGMAKEVNPRLKS